jgi:hypothetical protein
VSTSARTVLAGLLSLLASGCHGYLLPYDERPLPAQSTLGTQDGQRLTIAADGQLMSRPGRGDVAAALGVALYDSPQGLFVANALVAGSGLRRGDKVLWAAAALPKVGEFLQQEHEAIVHFAANEGQTSDLDNYQQLEPSSYQKLSFGRALPSEVASRPESLGPRPKPTPSEIRSRVGAHAVTKSDDLRGYVAAAGWLELDLLVEREGEQLVVRVGLERREAWVPTRPRLPGPGRWRGLELVPVRNLPQGLRPRAAAPDEVLVTRVARSSPLGQAGLRPLDLISEADARMLLGVSRKLPIQLREAGQIQLEARAPDGRIKRLEFLPRQEPTQLWFPFAFAYERNGDGYHFGLGWWDVLFHVSGRTEYSPDIDDYVETSRWSVLTMFSGGESRSEEGTVRSAGLNLIIDLVRMRYFEEWFDTPAKVRGERGLEGY